MSSAELLSAARDLVRRSQDVEADLLVHLGEIDERRLYLDCRFPSMFAFCVGELSFSEDAAYNRIMVARAGRRLPAIIDAIRDGRVHLWGMRLLIPHLTDANHRELIDHAAGKSKREIEELVAALAPRESVASIIRSVPAHLVLDGSAIAPPYSPAPGLAFTSNGWGADARSGSDADARDVSFTDEPLSLARPSPPPPPQRLGPSVVALAAQTYKVQFTAGRAFRDKLCEAQDLMRHRVPDGNLEMILGAALDLLIEQVKKERFAVGRKVKPRTSASAATPATPATPAASAVPATPAVPAASATSAPSTTSAPSETSNVSATASPAAETEEADQAREPASRHIPDAIKRAVYERDGGRCTFLDDRSQRCPATGALEFDHIGGFTGRHEVDKIRLLCRAHNQREAEKMYGRSFMESARKARGSVATRSGTSPPPQPEGQASRRA